MHTPLRVIRFYVVVLLFLLAFITYIQLYKFLRLRAETKITVITKKTFHASTVSCITVQWWKNNYYDEDANIESIIVCLGAYCVGSCWCVCVCLCVIQR